MDDRILRFALREMRRLLSAPRTWAILAASALILGLSGPFGTSSFLPFWPRMAYWLVVVVLTYTAGAFAHLVVSRLLRMPPGRRWLHQIVAGLATGLLVALILLLINWVALGVYPLERGYTLWLSLNVIAVSLVISYVIGLAEKPSAADTASAPAPTIRILNRLPIDKRGTLVSLSVQDHYVEINTTAGQTLVLMRLSDAIAETQGLSGLQVHRSHWVAVSQAVACKRNGDKAVLTMSCGRDIPVSRTYIKAVRAAGLLPR